MSLGFSSRLSFFRAAKSILIIAHSK